VTVDFLSDQIGFALINIPTDGITKDTYDYQLFQTLDGGNSWNMIGEWYHTPGDGNMIRPTGAIHFSDANTGVVAFQIGNAGGFLYTADGGTTWNTTYPPCPDDSGANFQQITQVSPSHYYAGGEMGSYLGVIWESTDSGATWTKATRSYNSNGNFYAGACTSLGADSSGTGKVVASFAYSGGNGSVSNFLIYYDPANPVQQADSSLPTGWTWNFIASTVWNDYSSEIAILGNQAWTCYTNDSNTEMVGSYDPGTYTWTWTLTNSFFNVLDISMANANKGFFCRGTIDVTYDGGNTFYTQNVGGGNPNGIFAFDDTHAIWQDSASGNETGTGDMIFSYNEPPDAGGDFSFEIQPLTGLPNPSFAAPGDTHVTVLPLLLSNFGPDNVVTVTKLAFQASGTGNAAADISAVNLYLVPSGALVPDQSAILLGSGTYSTTGSIVIDFSSTPITLVQWSPQTVVLTYDFAASLTGGSTYQASISPAGVVSSVAPTLPPGSAITSRTIQAATEIFEDNFENSLTNWTNGNDTINPFYIAGGVYTSPSNSLSMPIIESNQNWQTQTCTLTQALDFTNIREPILIFNTIYNSYPQGWGEYAFHYDVNVSTNGGSSWTTLQQLENPGAQITFTEECYDLSSTCSGQPNVLVQFSVWEGGNWQGLWNIDDVRILGAYPRLAFTTQPANGTAGSAFGQQPVVKLQDAFGNTITNDNQPITLAINSGPDGGVLLGANNPVTTVNGVAAFTNLEIDDAGVYTLTATGSTVSTHPGMVVSGTFNVAAGAATQLAFTTTPADCTAGSAFGTQPVVTLEDAYGNTVTGTAQNVTLSIFTGPSHVLSGTNFMAVTDGVAEFTDLEIDTAGTYTLTATGSTVMTSAPGALTSPFSVTPAAANTLVVTSFPSPTDEGIAHNVTVTAMDGYGNTATGYTGTVAITSSDGTATLPANAALVNGTGTFSVTLNTAGSQSITATDTVTATITGTQSEITVNPPISIASGPAATPNPTDAGQPVSSSSAASGGSDSFTYAWTFDDGGTGTGANPTYVYNTAGHYTATVTATDTLGGSQSASVAVIVNPVITFTAAPAATPNPTDVGQTVSFSSVASGGTGTLTYTWTFGDTVTETGASTNHVYATAGTPTATVTATDTLGVQTSATVAMTVNPKVSFPTTPAAAPNPAGMPTYGVGQPISFSAPAGGGSGALTYTWTFSDGGTGTGASPSHAYTAAGTYTATVTATDALGNSTSTTITVIVAAPIVGTGTDITGNGYSDSFLAATGFVPSQPATAGAVQDLVVSSTSIKLDFAKPTGNDAISMSGTLAIPTGLTVKGQTVAVDIGGIMESFTLDSTGVSPKGDNLFTVGVKATKGVVDTQTAKYIVKLTKGSFITALATYNLVKGTTKSTTTSVTVPVSLIFNGNVLQKNVTLSYKATSKSGTAH
jgi:PKD repeat protein